MLKRYKDLMRTLVGELRHILVGTTNIHGIVIRGDLDRELERLGIAPDGTILPFDVLAHPTSDEQWAYRVAVTQLEVTDKIQRASTRMEIVERAAYSWINRLFALRAMESRGLIEETLHNNPDYEGISEALFILRQVQPDRASDADGGRWAVLEDACAAQSAALPGLFTLNDPLTALRPSTPALMQCMRYVGGTMESFSLEESDAAFADPDAIGWAYQFYQEEAKAEIYAKLGKGGKVSTRSEIAAATQLFTEPYMVKWLLQNSLGRSYHEMYPNSTLPTTWEYYVKPDQLDTSTTFNFASLTVLDPCMGSGHFLREAFDMFVAMYHEQFQTFSATEIADRILSHHVYGIDIDPRAAQLSALTLYLRAWELVRDERRKEHKLSLGNYTPHTMNLATTPTNLTEGALQRHLHRHPQDMPLKPLLEGIFAGLEQADILGSLLRPKEYLDHAIAELQRPHTMRIDFDPEGAELRRTITEMANRDPAGLKQMLLSRIADAFKVEASNTDDVGAALFGQEAEYGVRLLQLLDRCYSIVVTNPPYMGSKNMDIPLKKYVEKYYPSGKRDLYAAFILRCLELCRPSGRVAMVTMQSWMFLSSFTELRAMPEEKLLEIRKPRTFIGLLRETCIEALAHLGSNAFEEISGEVVQSAMMIFVNRLPSNEQRIMAFRLVGMRSVKKKSTSLRGFFPETSKVITNPLQKDFLAIPGSPIVYYLNGELLTSLIKNKRLQDVADVRQGLATADDNRFIRYTWEILSNSKRWATFTKGGGYCKWFGLNWYHVDWEYAGGRTRAFGKGRYQGSDYYFHFGWSYSRICRGSASMRFLDIPGCIGDKGPGIYTDDISLPAILQSHALSFILRAISPQLAFEVNTVMQAPLPDGESRLLAVLAKMAEMYKRLFISGLVIERTFADTHLIKEDRLITCWLHFIEGVIERIVCQAYNLSDSIIQTIINDTGTPVGWFPAIDGYDTLPPLIPSLDISSLPQELLDYLEMHERFQPNGKELARIKNNLRTLYEAGIGAKSVEQVETDELTGKNEDGEEMPLGAHIPIPTETFLEELSVKMQLHPISVYWLLEELRAEGMRCKPEKQRLLEDRLSVLVLRLLGHRWPKQLEAGEAVPDWADRDGIIPLVAGTGKITLAEQVRARLQAEDGELGTQQVEALLAELMNVSLDEWLRKRFFLHHVPQFKYRPIAWHLMSTPVNNGKKKRGNSQRTPAFECLLYYHACAGDVLARIRTQYVEPLIRAERQKMEDASLFQNDTASVLVHDRIQELETFVEKLRFIEEQGFACPELDTIIAVEPLDRWSGDGFLPPANKDELRHNEQAWHVDINDGVRVNIAPLQLADALADDVLKLVDAKKALADRARWRADERRWVRDGKLPRCGWMDEQIPESPRWTEREPERIAEQRKLEQKRLAIQNKHTEEAEL